MKIMNKKWTATAIGAGLFVAGLALTPACTTEDSDALYLYESADAYRGGNLWDKWWKVPGIKEGIQPGTTVSVDGEDVTSSFPADNPLYAKGEGGKSGNTTWRCKECHGWDYQGADGAYGSGSHHTGFKGVLGTKKSVTELFDIIKNGTGTADVAGHSFGTVLEDQDIANLVKFVLEGAVDTSTLVKSDKTPLGEATAGEPLFAGNCASCHGNDGMKINFKSGYHAEYLYTIAADNPWEFMHKVRFGQPDGAMPNGAVKGYVLKDVADILAYAQTLAPQGLETAAALRGGVLYDKWWAENGSPKPTTTNPAYPSAGGKSGNTTWRCKECHGWDYKGVDGAYGSGSHFTGLTGVWNAQDWDAADLLAIIGQGKKQDGTTIDGHAFEGTDLLSGGDVADLALFIKTGLVDDAESISYVTKRAKGSAIAGHALWETNCETCHGDLGTNVNFAHDDAPPAAEYVATVARDNPFELIHKVRWGNPGSDADAAEMEETLGIVTGHMPNAIDAGYTEAQVANIVAFAQTLPAAVERGGMAWDKWWEVRGAAEPIKPGSSIVDADGNTVNSSLPATNPLYTSAGSGTKSGNTTWRCKECHGWDYKGKDGIYATGSHATGINGVFASTMTDDELYAAIADGVLASGTESNHAFRDLIGDFVIRDLVTFLTADPAKEIGAKRDIAAALVDSDSASTTYKGVLVLSAATDPGRTREANYNLGRIKFEGTCAGCHGADGRAINFAEGDGEQEYVSTVAKDNPWEFLNKVMHGQPGSEPVMPNAAGQYWDLDDLADILLYVQDLP